MSESSKVVDGADRRKIRLLDLLHFIHTQGGATSEDIQAFMTLKYGLKHKTTSEYIQELHIANVICRMGTVREKWFTTGRYKKLAQLLYGE